MISIINHMLDIWCGGDRNLFRSLITWLYNALTGEIHQQPLVIVIGKFEGNYRFPKYGERMVSFFQRLLASSDTNSPKGEHGFSIAIGTRMRQLEQLKAARENYMVFTACSTPGCLTFKQKCGGSRYNYIGGAFSTSNPVLLKPKLKLLANVSPTMFRYILDIYLSKWKIFQTDIVITSELDDFILLKELYGNHIGWCINESVAKLQKEAFSYELSSLLKRPVICDNELEIELIGFYLSDLVGNYTREKLKRSIPKSQRLWARSNIRKTRQQH